MRPFICDILEGICLPAPGIAVAGMRGRGASDGPCSFNIVKFRKRLTSHKWEGQVGFPLFVALVAGNYWSSFRLFDHYT